MESDPPITFRAPTEIKVAARHVAVMCEFPTLSDALKEWTAERVLHELANEFMRRHGFERAFHYLLAGIDPTKH